MSAPPPTAPTSEAAKVRTKTHKLFITDVEYDSDETKMGRVYTGLTGAVAPGTLIKNNTADATSLFKDLKDNSIVRFVSTAAYTVTDYMMVRSLTRYGSSVHFSVDAPVTLDYADDYYVYLVREWIPRTLQLQSRFQHVLGVKVIAFAFTGIDGGNLYEGITGEPQHDYIGLEIRELPGRMRSTNRYMDSMLAVLPTKMDSYHPSSWNDARDGMIYVPEAVGRTCYDEPLNAVSALTPRLINRRGESIRAARFHLWLELTALDK